MPSDDDLDLGPMPEPQIEPGEPNPGGVDAIDDFSGPIAIPDLTPDENPAINENVPDSVKDDVSDSEDTSTKATRDEHDPAEDEPDEEAPV